MTINEQDREKIKAMLKRRGLTQHQLAQQLKVSPPYLNRVLRGRIAASVDQVDRIVSVLHGRVVTLILADNESAVVYSDGQKV